MTKTSPRLIPHRRGDSSRQAAFTFLSNISLGNSNRRAQQQQQSQLPFQQQNRIRLTKPQQQLEEGEIDPSSNLEKNVEYEKNLSFPIKIKNNDKENNINGTDYSDDINKKPVLHIDTKKVFSTVDKVSDNEADAGNHATPQTRISSDKKIFNNDKTSSIGLKEGCYDNNLNNNDSSSSRNVRSRNNSLREEAAVHFLTNIINLDPNKNRHHPSKESLTSPTITVSGLEASDDGLLDEVDGNADDQENFEGSLSSPSSAYVGRRRSSASSLNSDTSSSSSSISNISPSSPNNPIIFSATHSKLEQHRLKKRHDQTDNWINVNSVNNKISIHNQNNRQNSVGSFLTSSTPLGIFSMLGYSDKKFKHQRNNRDDSYIRKKSTDLGMMKNREFIQQAESFAHLLTPSEALSPKKIKNDYDPEYLDDPELKTERQPSSNDIQEAKPNKHRPMLSLSGLMGSFISHNTRPVDIKREANTIFRQSHPEIDPSLTLSQIRKVKVKLLAAATYENLDLELSTVAKSYAYFEKLILKNIVKKSNRKLIGAICLLLASKANEPIKMTYTHLLESLHKHLEVTTKEILEQEFSVFSFLEFELYLHDREYMPHFERLFDVLNIKNKQGYLGDDPFYQIKYSKENNGH